MTFTTLITGASSGLGAEMARQFAALGHDLALTARRTDLLEDLKTEITTAHPGRRVEVYALDVTDDDAVTAVFEQAKGDLGRLDRVVVNAGLGKGAPYGKGSHYANRQTIETNVLGAAIQAEAAMAIFREQRSGHLVLIASITALRGMPKSMTTYGASKAFLASLGEGIRSEMMGKPELAIDVSVLYPGYIRSEMNEKVEQKTKFMVDTDVGVRAMVEAMEARKPKAYVPAKPWVPLGKAMEHLPLSVVRKLMT